MPEFTGEADTTGETGGGGREEGKVSFPRHASDEESTDRTLSSVPDKNVVTPSAHTRLVIRAWLAELSRSSSKVEFAHISVSIDNARAETLRNCGKRGRLSNGVIRVAYRSSGPHVCGSAPESRGSPL